MEFLLGSVAVRLLYSDKDLDTQLGHLFHGWNSALREGSNERPFLDNQFSVTRVLFSLDVLNHQLDVPKGIPFFKEAIQTTGGSPGRVSIFEGHDEVIIYFDDGVRVQLPPLKTLEANEIHLHAMLTRRLLHAGRLEDVLFSGLAPVLKRRGYSLVHGFSAAGPKGATVVIGPSGSGKTTVGLGLVIAGWGYLANDIVLLKKESDGIYALPAPGVIGVTARTFELLPGLQATAKGNYAQNFSGKRYYPVIDLVRNWSKSTRVNRICMPEVCPGRPTQLKKSNKAIALARLLEGSVDRWDTARLEEQVDLLKDLVGQSEVFELESGEHIAEWSDLL